MAIRVASTTSLVYIVVLFLLPLWFRFDVNFSSAFRRVDDEVAAIRFDAGGEGGIVAAPPELDAVFVLVVVPLAPYHGIVRWRK